MLVENRFCICIIDIVDFLFFFSQPCKKMPYSSLPNAIEEDFDKSLIDSSKRFDEMSDKILHNMTVKALSQELEGMVYIYF